MTTDYRPYSEWAGKTEHSNYFLCDGTEERLSDCENNTLISSTSRDTFAIVNCTYGKWNYIRFYAYIF